MSNEEMSRRNFLIKTGVVGAGLAASGGALASEFLREGPEDHIGAHETEDITEYDTTEAYVVGDGLHSESKYETREPFSRIETVAMRPVWMKIEM